MASIIYFGAKELASLRPQNPHPAAGQHFVKRVVDGDTLKLSDGSAIRLIGVDTPEYHYSNKLARDASRSREDVKAIQALGERAYEFTKGLAGGRTVRLEFDVVKRDKYGRLLAYVYLDDGAFLNAKIIEEGYGQVMTIPPNVKYSALFLKLQREAREAGRGLWKEKAYEGLARR
jgi:micrococcal nuclease